MENEESLGERLKIFIHDQRINQKIFAEKMGLTGKQVSQYIRGAIKPTSDTLVRMFSIFGNINLHWLLTGKGKMFVEEDVMPNFFTYEDIARSSLEEAEIAYKTSASEMEKINNRLTGIENLIAFIKKEHEDLQRQISENAIAIEDTVLAVEGRVKALEEKVKELKKK